MLVQTLELCLRRDMFLPVELRKIVATYFVDRINTANIQYAAQLPPRTRTMRFGPIEWWDTSTVEDMSRVFEGQEEFNSDISRWDVSNVMAMTKMFHGAIKFNKPLNSWNVSSVMEMECMFARCFQFNKPLDKWDVSNVRLMQCMFMETRKFNQPLNTWNVRKVVNMEFMFYGARKFNQPLDQWMTESVECTEAMFAYSESFNQPSLFTSWCLNSPKLVSARDMFEGSSLMKEVVIPESLRGKYGPFSHLLT